MRLALPDRGDDPPRDGLGIVRLHSGDGEKAVDAAAVEGRAHRSRTDMGTSTPLPRNSRRSAWLKAASPALLLE